jgi:hypothetical protein
MKKGIFLFAFLFAFGMAAVDAQSCQGKAASASKACCMKADKAAAADATIEKRMADDGTVAYVRKESDAQGNVKFVSVKYDATNDAFVNVAPKAATASATAGMTKKSCAAGASKACCAKGASQGKACCASKAKAAAPDMEQK